MEKSPLVPREFIIVEILEYNPDMPTFKTVVRKTTGNVTAVSFTSDDSFGEKISPVDTFLQVLDGKVEILRNGDPHFLEAGHSIIIPATATLQIKAHQSFKLISSCIKSAHE